MFPVPVIFLLLLFLFAAFVTGTIRHHESMRRRILSLFLALLICLCLFGINLRVMKHGNDGQYERPALDVLFVTDTTISMWAEDYGNSKTRISGATQTMNHIMEQMSGSSFSLVTFDSESTIRCPLTQDIQCIADVADAFMQPDEFLAKGSSLNAPHDNVERMLTHMGGKDEHMRIVFFLSDGEITNEEALASYADLAKMCDGGAVLGFGTAEGAKMNDAYGDEIMDPEDYEPAISKLDETTLRQLSDDLEVPYIHVTEDTDVDAVIKDDLLQAQTVIEEREDLTNYEDTYFYLVPVLLALLMAELFLFKE